MIWFIRELDWFNAQVQLTDSVIHLQQISLFTQAYLSQIASEVLK